VAVTAITDVTVIRGRLATIVTTVHSVWILVHRGHVL